MGRDKSRLTISGQTLLESAMAALKPACSEIIIAGGWQRPEDWPGIEAAWVPDPPGFAGPLAGLAAGLAAAPRDECLVIACDMPFVSTGLLGEMVHRLPPCDAVMPFVGGCPQPLHAAYSASRCLPTVRSLLRLGARSMRDLLPRVCVAYFGDQRCRELDPDGLSWFNMNTPEDLRFAASLAARQAQMSLPGWASAGRERSSLAQ
jgi:molybdopterin-guanine dinucleotide biosynthesis protein A